MLFQEARILWEVSGNARKSTTIKTLNIHSNSGVFRANLFCISIIIDCLRDYFSVLSILVKFD